MVQLLIVNIFASYNSKVMHLIRQTVNDNQLNMFNINGIELNGAVVLKTVRSTIFSWQCIESSSLRAFKH